MTSTSREWETRVAGEGSHRGDRRAYRGRRRRPSICRLPRDLPEIARLPEPYLLEWAGVPEGAALEAGRRGAPRCPDAEHDRPGDPARATVRAHPDLPVIMVSGQQVPSTIVDAVRLGAIDYVVKADDAGGVHEAALEAAICRAVERTALTSEVARLSTQVAEAPDGSQPCWSSGAAMREVMLMIERVSDSDVSVLISGESGVGKEVVARELHRRSGRRADSPSSRSTARRCRRSCSRASCSATSAGPSRARRPRESGKFEFAERGHDPSRRDRRDADRLQAKLLHVLQDAEFTRLGSNRQVGIDVRVVAATNRDLGSMLRAGRLARRPVLPPAGHRDSRPAAPRPSRRDSRRCWNISCAGIPSGTGGRCRSRRRFCETR